MPYFERLSTADYLSLNAASSRGRIPVVRRHKYNAKRTAVGDQVFDSAKEAKTYQLLQLAQSAADADKRVIQITRSVRYLLIPAQAGERACHYVADFKVTYADGHEEVWDTKSVITRKNPLYIVKRKLMLERFGIRILEV